MIAAHPLTGVGPNMVERVYAEYRDPTAVEPGEPAPAQRAAADCGRARSAGARGIWLWFVVGWRCDLSRKLATTRHRLAGGRRAGGDCRDAGGGAVRHNFGDSEFLMLFLVLITLPFAADRTDLP